MVLVDWLFWPAVVGLYAFLGAWTHGYASAAGVDRLDSLFIGTGWPISWVMFPVYWVIQTLIVPLLGGVSRLGRIAHDGLPEYDAEPDVDLQIESEDERLSREIEEAHKQSNCVEVVIQNPEPLEGESADEWIERVSKQALNACGDWAHRDSA